ncbi:MAG: hypothetical protein ACOYO1_09095 [Bacteroidales bacterium]
MKYELKKNKQLSGNKASIYTIYIHEENKTLLDIFIEENKILHISELNDIILRLNVIGKKTGAREQFFKLKEGKPGDLVCALYDNPDSKLRLYCIRFGSLLIIAGGGGPKSKKIRALQDDEKLTQENKIIRNLSEEIYKRTKEGNIKIINDGMDFEGDLDFEF